MINCKAPSGKIPDSIIARTTVSVKKDVIVAGFTIAGTPANKLTATFSNIPQTGKLKALICIATPRFGVKICVPKNVPFLDNLCVSPST